ncbi:MAG: hypothetical protein ACRC0V_01480 [Fusobacteriaceae bacterium]
MDITTWEEHLYDTTFNATFESLIQQYKDGKLPLEELEMNISEQQVIMLNASTEGAVRFQYCSAMIDAHQYALALIKKNNI